MWFERRRWRDGVGKKLKTAVSANTANGLFCRDYRDGSGKPPVVFVVLDYGINEQGGGLWWSHPVVRARLAIEASETLSQLLPYPDGPRLAAVPLLLIFEFTFLAEAPSQPAKPAGHGIALLACRTGAWIVTRSAATEAIELCLLPQEGRRRIVITLSSGAAQHYARKPENSDEELMAHGWFRPLTAAHRRECALLPISRQ